LEQFYCRHAVADGGSIGLERMTGMCVCFIVVLKTDRQAPISRPLFQDNLDKPMPERMKVKPVWILMKQKMIRWQWHQLDHMQIICTSLQTDNYPNTSSLNFFTGWYALPDSPWSVKALNAVMF